MTLAHIGSHGTLQNGSCFQKVACTGRFLRNHDKLCQCCLELLHKANNDNAKLVFSAFSNFSEEIRVLAASVYVDIKTAKVAQLAGLNRNPVNHYFQHFRHQLAQLCEAESLLHGRVEIPQKDLPFADDLELPG